MVVRRILLLAFGVSGAAALIYEVVWTRALVLVLGSTTYAVSTMLSAFMGGLAVGGWLGGHLADRQQNLARVFALLEAGIACFGLLTIWMINALPPLYFSIFKGLSSAPVLYFAVQLILCFAIMLLPTTLMGATFPVVSKAITGELSEMGQRVGNAYSFNTVGAVLGSVFAGFLFIPLVGLETTTVIAAGLNLLGAVVVAAAAKLSFSPKSAALVLAAVGLSTAAALHASSESGKLGFHNAARYQSYGEFEEQRSQLEVLYSRWHAEGLVRLWRRDSGYLILEHNGRIEGSGVTDVANTTLIAYLPIASHPNPTSLLNIGLGTGLTLAAAKEHVPNVHLVEINKGVIEALRAHGPAGLLDDVEVHVADARQFIASYDQRFDVIASEPSYPTDEGAANLFTREFYELAAGALNPGGVFCQWLPYYAMANEDVTMMLRTFGSVFPEIYLWKVEHSLDLIMVGAQRPFDLSEQEIRARVDALNVRDLPLPFVLSRTPERVREVIATEPGPLNTDDHPILEFHVAMNFLTNFRN